jgi:PAS domain S-box-containing protein
MTTANRPRKELMAKIESLTVRLEEAEETLRAIGNGEVDAFVVTGPGGEQVFTLKGAEQPYRALVETMNEGAATLSAEGTILYCNKRLAAMLRIPLGNIIGTMFVTYVDAPDKPLIAALLKKSAEESVTGEVTLISGEGDAVQVLVSSREFDLSGSRGITMIITDLTLQQRNDEIMAAGMLADSIIEQAGEAIVVCAEDGMIIRASRITHRLCGVNPLLTSFDELLPLQRIATGSFFSVMPLMKSGESENSEVVFTRSDNQIFNLLLNATPLSNIQNRIFGCVVTLIDITDRKKADEQIRASLREKEVLLKEIHHRVKNNLQIIASLLKLQSRYCSDGKTVDVFRECQDRVRAMANVHSLLYRSKDFARINFRDYVRETTGELLRIYQKSPVNISLDFHADEVMLSIDEAIPCSLIINELVTNALKYAFTETGHGEIRIELAETEQGIRLVVKDNGIGFPPELNFRETETLGLQLVNMLVKQLDGTMEQTIDGGTGYALQFGKKRDSKEALYAGP